MSIIKTIIATLSSVITTTPVEAKKTLGLFVTPGNAALATQATADAGKKRLGIVVATVAVAGTVGAVIAHRDQKELKSQLSELDKQIAEAEASATVQRRILAVARAAEADATKEATASGIENVNERGRTRLARAEVLTVQKAADAAQVAADAAAKKATADAAAQKGITDAAASLAATRLAAANKVKEEAKMVIRTLNAQAVASAKASSSEIAELRAELASAQKAPEGTVPLPAGLSDEEGARLLVSIAGTRNAAKVADAAVAARLVEVAKAQAEAKAQAKADAKAKAEAKAAADALAGGIAETGATPASAAKAS